MAVLAKLKEPRSAGRVGMALWWTVKPGWWSVRSGEGAGDGEGLLELEEPRSAGRAEIAVADGEGLVGGRQRMRGRGGWAVEPA